MTQNIEEKIKKLTEQLGYQHVSPSIIQPATAYFDMLSDNLRRQLLIVQDAFNANGQQDYVLRPEFTICTLRDYLQNNNVGKPARLAYSGPIFRSGAQSETTQTGIEIFAAKDSFKADIETIEYALNALDILDITDVKLKMGDYALFFTLVDNLDISDIWRKKLKRLFLSQNTSDELLEKLKKPQIAPISTERAAFLNAIEGLEINAAQMLVENVLSFNSIDLIGGRSASEIAERFLEQAALSANPTLPESTLQILNEYFNISGDAQQAIKQLKTFNKKHSLKLDNKIAQITQRFDAVAALKFNIENVIFCPLLGRGFEYYTGMVFEIIDAKMRIDTPLIAGGRYDGLAKQLGAKQNINAVGASLWNVSLATVIKGASNV